MSSATSRRSGGLAGLLAAAAVTLAACSSWPTNWSVARVHASVQRIGATVRPSTVGYTGSADIGPTGPLDPSFFAKGSCVAFGPTHGNRHQTVYLDAGHGGVDPGGVGTTDSGAAVYEENLTLPVELDTATLLRADGYRVVLSRTTGGPVARPAPGAVAGGIYTTAGAHEELVARVMCANDARASVLVGIYFDAGYSSYNAGSMTAYDEARPFAAANLRLATLLQRNVLAAMNAHGWQIPDGGVSSDIYDGGPPLTSAAAAYDHLLLLGPAMAGYLSTPTEMPGAVIEPLFVTDPFEATIAVSSLGQHVIAGGIAKSVEEFLG